MEQRIDDFKSDIQAAMAGFSFTVVDGRVCPFIMGTTSDEFPEQWDEQTEKLRKAFQGIWDVVTSYW
jgi:hypothetical protein